jgi:hypothetical protein
MGNIHALFNEMRTRSAQFATLLPEATFPDQVSEDEVILSEADTWPFLHRSLWEAAQNGKLCSIAPPPID